MKADKVYGLLVDLIHHEDNVRRHNTTIYSGFCIAIVVAAYYADKILCNIKFLWAAGILITIFWFLSVARSKGYMKLRMEQAKEIEKEPSFENDNWKIFSESYEKQEKKFLTGSKSVSCFTGQLALPVIMFLAFVYLLLVW